MSRLSGARRQPDQRDPSRIIEEVRHVLGPEVSELEAKRSALGRAPALTCGDGADALALPLGALVLDVLAREIEDSSHR
ncbi:hypothetical protein ACWCOP_13560 [Maricaulaceae bacterium MS644]